MPKGGKGGGGNNGGINGNKRDNVLNGTENADLMDGRGGNDTLQALGGDDTLIGGSGDDQLIGGAGSDNIDGGEGNDTAVWAGNRDDYVVTEIAPGTVEIVGPEGVDVVTGVEIGAVRCHPQSLGKAHGTVVAQPFAFPLTVG